MADENMQQPQGEQTPPQPTIDYDKIQQMLDGTLKAKEDTALRAYFKQQGLSPEEAAQAIESYKQQKAASQPDIGAIQGQLTEAQGQVKAAQQAALQAQIQTAATMAAVELGIGGKAIPYVLRMADFSAAADKEGKLSDEAIKAAVSKVLEDIPALKPQPDASSGFRQIGTGGNPSQHPGQGSPAQKPVATKKWNRFNNT